MRIQGLYSGCTTSAKLEKGSPVWADGKLYVTEVNGGFVILQPGVDKCETLNTEEISRADEEHYVEISMAHRLLLMDGSISRQKNACTVSGGETIMKSPFSIYAALIVCLLVVGCASKEMAPEPVEMNTAPAVSLLLTPAEKLTSGDPIEFSVIGFDANGKQTSAVGAMEWMKTGLTGDTSKQYIHTR